MHNPSVKQQNSVSVIRTTLFCCFTPDLPILYTSVRGRETYSYLADGTKVSALDSEGDGLVYLGSLIYRKTGNAIELESAGFAGGMFVAKDAAAGGKRGI